MSDSVTAVVVFGFALPGRFIEFCFGVCFRTMGMVLIDVFSIFIAVLLDGIPKTPMEQVARYPQRLRQRWPWVKMSEQRKIHRQRAQSALFRL
jgi:hypothetical protein